VGGGGGGVGGGGRRSSTVAERRKVMGLLPNCGAGGAISMLFDKTRTDAASSALCEEGDGSSAFRRGKEERYSLYRKTGGRRATKPALDALGRKKQYQVLEEPSRGMAPEATANQGESPPVLESQLSMKAV